jgi:hypothetical protein
MKRISRGELHAKEPVGLDPESGEVSDGTTLRDPDPSSRRFSSCRCCCFRGSDVGEVWRTVADVADWLIGLMFAAEVADLDLCAHAQRERVE